MWTKPYGKTGKQVSVIGFGAMRFDNPADIDTNAEIVLYAQQRGITYLDTAPGYCDDHSEDIVGAAIKQMKPGSFTVSTKSFASKGDDIRASLEKSLKRLNVEKIDFFHIWCILNLQAWEGRKAGGAVAALQKAKEEGLIGHVVVSSHMGGDDLAKMLGEGVFEGITLGYCAINFPYRDAGVQAAHRMGMGVAAMNPLGGGIIPQNAERLSFLCGPNDDSVVQAALRFVVSQPGISTALVGFTTKQHVDEAIAAVENFQPYTAEHVEKVRKNILGCFDGLCTGCGYCLPCPQGVPIPQLMDVYNLTQLGDPKPWEINGRMKWHWNIPFESAAACSLCGACEDNCTQHLNIRERLTALKDVEFPKVEKWRAEQEAKKAAAEEVKKTK